MGYGQALLGGIGVGETTATVVGATFQVASLTLRPALSPVEQFPIVLEVHPFDGHQKSTSAKLPSAMVDTGCKWIDRAAVYFSALPRTGGF